MRRKTFLFGILLVVAFFVASCSQNTILAEAPNETISQKISEEQKCSSVTCGENQECSEGNCICQKDFKKCDDKCISNYACCASQDCEEGKFCDENNKCKSLPKQCDYHQEWNQENETCACVKGTKFCEGQSKCIPETNCCTVLDCTFRRDICLDTKYAARICVNDGNLHCKSVVGGQSDTFTLQNKNYKIQLNNLVEKGTANILINKNTSKALLFNQTIALDENTKIFVDQIKTTGGVCKTYND